MDTTFKDFANVWTPVAFASELGSSKPLANDSSISESCSLSSSRKANCTSA